MNVYLCVFYYQFIRGNKKEEFVRRVIIISLSDSSWKQKR